MPNNPITHYNLACMWGREGNSTQRLQELTDAVDFGYDKYHLVESDSDFDSVRKERPNAFARRYCQDCMTSLIRHSAQSIVVFDATLTRELQSHVLTNGCYCGHGD